MIHHISIAANNPSHVAHVLAELVQGQVTEFTNHKGSYVVITLDAYGTMIEVHPQGLELVPGTGDKGVQHRQGLWLGYTPVHVAISVPVSESTISEIGLREGWRVVRCNRDGFLEVIEFWIENQMMLELLPPAETEKYLALTQPESMQQVLAAFNHQKAES